jgi:hypothetical protein
MKQFRNILDGSHSLLKKRKKNSNINYKNKSLSHKQIQAELFISSCYALIQKMDLWVAAQHWQQMRKLLVERTSLSKKKF